MIGSPLSLPAADRARCGLGLLLATVPISAALACQLPDAGQVADPHETTPHQTTPHDATQVNAASVATLATDDSCRIGADALKTAEWANALIVDLRRADELTDVQIPTALTLRRTDAEGLLATDSELTILLLGSGLDDAALQPLCARLSITRRARVALLAGGLPAWVAADRPVRVPEFERDAGSPILLHGAPAKAALARRMRLDERALATLMADPALEQLVLDPTFAPPADATRATKPVVALSTRAALDAARAWLAERPVEQANAGSRLIIVASDARLIARLQTLSAESQQPFWIYAHDAERLQAWRNSAEAQRLAATAQRSGACRWN